MTAEFEQRVSLLSIRARVALVNYAFCLSITQHAQCDARYHRLADFFWEFVESDLVAWDRRRSRVDAFSVFDEQTSLSVDSVNVLALSVDDVAREYLYGEPEQGVEATSKTTARVLMDFVPSPDRALHALELMRRSDDLWGTRRYRGDYWEALLNTLPAVG